MRRRDPRRLLARRRRARARVSLVQVPQSGYSEDGAIGSKQVAEVTLPRAELDQVWTTENLERLARTYWSFLTRISLGLLRVLYTESTREVVVLTRPFVLLRFKAPRYETDGDRGSVTWPIDRGLLVARSGRGRGYLRLAVSRVAEPGRGRESTAIVTSEVVNFYPTIAAWGASAPIRWITRIGRFVYNQTQLRLHVVVTNGFLRSLANLELEPSVVGRLAGGGSANPASPPRSPAASPGRGER